MSFWTLDNLRTVTGGRWRTRRLDMPQSWRLHGVSIDSRSCRAGQVFVAIRGERFDGHDYLEGAAAKGASLLVVEEGHTAIGEALGELVSRYPMIPVLSVADTRACLLRLASSYRKTLKRTTVIAVTGSNGKTTTVRLIDAILGKTMAGASSPKSFNNDIGVPLTVLSAKDSDSYLICEVGMNAPGEIGPLAKVIRPDIAVITMIGRAHIGGLGSIEAIAQEKATLLSYLNEGGLAVVHGDSPTLEPYTTGLARVVRFGEGAHCDLRLTEFVGGGVGGRSRLTINGRWDLETALEGAHNAMNALAAIAVARRMRLTDEQIEAGLLGARPPQMRMERHEVGGMCIINDAYNASPESVLAALRSFAADGHSGRRVVVLGELLELGEHAEGVYGEVARAIVEIARPDLLIVVGEGVARVGELARGMGVGVLGFEGAATADVAGALERGDLVLLKGSRGAGLERVLEAVVAREDGGGGARGEG